MILQSLWRERRDNPIFLWRLNSIKENVRLSCEAESCPELDFAVEGTLPDVNEASPILLACGDEIYFYRFARQLALTMKEHSPSTRFHLHLFEPSALCVADAQMLEARIGKQLSISYETGKRNPYGRPHIVFFAAGRFAIARYLIERNHAPVMVIDIDGRVRRDLTDAFDALKHHDVGVVWRRAQYRPWRTILACAVFLNTTEPARLFAARLAEALRLSLMKQPAYHVDQTTLHYLLHYYSFHHLRLTAANLGLTWCDHQFREGSLIWSAKGKRKADFLRFDTAEAGRIVSGTSVRLGGA
jgi:hypothetical protein